VRWRFDARVPGNSATAVLTLAVIDCSVGDTGNDWTRLVYSTISFMSTLQARGIINARLFSLLLREMGKSTRNIWPPPFPCCVFGQIWIIVTRQQCLIVC